MTSDEGTDERRMTSLFYFVIRQSSIAIRQFLFILCKLKDYSLYIACLITRDIFLKDFKNTIKEIISIAAVINISK